MSDNKKIILSQSVCDGIDHWLAKFPPEQKRSAVLQALRIVQDDHQGFLTEELMDAVAEYLGLPPIAVYEVATFYSMYNLKPVGKHVINVCTNISCMLCDSEKMLHHFKERLGIELNQTTPDGKFTLREVECLAACVNAPVALIGKKYYENLTPEKIDTILQDLEVINSGK